MASRATSKKIARFLEMNRVLKQKIEIHFHISPFFLNFLKIYEMGYNIHQHDSNSNF